MPARGTATPSPPRERRKPARPAVAEPLLVPRHVQRLPRHSGERGLLIDFGSGAILDHLDEAGRPRDRVGPPYAPPSRPVPGRPPASPSSGVPIARPGSARPAFSPTTDAFWRLKRDLRQLRRSSIGTPSPARCRSPGAPRLRAFSWRGHDIRVLPTPGHTKARSPSSSRSTAGACASAATSSRSPAPSTRSTTSSGSTACPTRVGAALHSRPSWRGSRSSASSRRTATHRTTRAAALHALAPTSGACTGSSARYARTASGPCWPHTVDQPKRNVLPHLWANPHSCPTVRPLRRRRPGTAPRLRLPLLGPFRRRSPLRRALPGRAKAVAGLERSTPSSRATTTTTTSRACPGSSRRRAPSLDLRELRRVVANPAGYNIPCLLPTPIRVDALPDGEPFAGTGDVRRLPHARAHLVGARPLWRDRRHPRCLHRRQPAAGHVSPLRAAAPVYRNKMLVGLIALGVRRLRSQARAHLDRPHRRLESTARSSTTSSPGRAISRRRVQGSSRCPRRSTSPSTRTSRRCTPTGTRPRR